MSPTPHLDQPAHEFGPAPEATGMAVILIHGRTQGPQDMVAIADRLNVQDVSYVALQASDNSWYPDKFMAPLENNRPHLDHALARVEVAVGRLEDRGIPRSRIVLLGFSQGACLACEFVYRNPTRWGGLVAYTGGLIGPEQMTWLLDRKLQRTPIFLGNGDADPWVPLARTDQTATVFGRMGGDVELETYPGREHAVCDDEIAHGRAIIQLLKQSVSAQVDSRGSNE
ncbi:MULTISPECIES: dienelactone hydrolase family protein [Pseudomonas]|uniref:alpha/beta hydrolase n=1 Tax=Pseudomonas TaxID=286 RepID=UPI0015B872E8|nr:MULTISPECIES: dienelactone hydrolase family protein [Pseudomonas]